ncbi:MAG: hypothetical protein ABIN35_00725 [candidate division WOR-3 bacterium]
MTNLFLNVDELLKVHERSIANKYELFNQILVSCHNKIKRYNSELKKQECLFQPPLYVIGKPPYDYAELVEYLITSLKQNGLRAEWSNDSKSIYISWKRSDVNMDIYRQNAKINHPYTITDETIKSGTGSPQILTVVTAPPPNIREPIKANKNKKKKSEQKPVDLAFIEYNPGVSDFIPINTQ